MRKHDCGVALYPPPEVGGFTATTDKKIPKCMHIWAGGKSNTLYRCYYNKIIIIVVKFRSIDKTGDWRLALSSKE